MENVKFWFMENWQLILRMIHHQIFFEWGCWLVGSLIGLLLFSIIYSNIKIKSNPSEKPDRIIYKSGMLAFIIQAIIFIVYPILFRSAILLFSWVLFSPFIIVLAIDICWFFILKAKYENNPEDLHN